MMEFNEFAKKFTDNVPDSIKAGNEFFLAREELVKTALKINSDYVSIGLYLGKMKGKWFEPSIAAFDVLSKESTKKAKITDDAAWLFLCDRDIFEDSVLDSKVNSGPVLVQTKKDENLGYGLKTSKGITHILDKGKYIRS